MVTDDAVVALRIAIETGSGTLRRRITSSLRQAIEQNVFTVGDVIPPTRQLAAMLGVARGTVVAALDTLIAEGLLTAHVGVGTQVAPAAKYVQHAVSVRPAKAQPSRLFADPAIDQPSSSTYDFRPCRPAVDDFPRNAWRRCLNATALAPLDSDYGDAKGSHSLRLAIANYLRRSRGMAIDTSQILVSNGAVHGMHLLAQTYLNPGDVVAVENPGYRLAQQVFELAQARLLLCPVDVEGIVLEPIIDSRTDVRLVYTTPAHQFPKGARLSLARRHQLVEWAGQRGALIIEDDYDGEFRYDVPPLPPLATLSNESVVYCGTFSKTMFPGLRLGFVVAHPETIDTLARYRTLTEYCGPQPTQLALSQFIEQGHYEKHVHAMRKAYARRRRILMQAVEHAQPIRLCGLDSGLNGLLELDSHWAAAAVAARAAELSVNIPPITRYCANSGSDENALVCGYAAMPDEQLREGLERLLSLFDR